MSDEVKQRDFNDPSGDGEEERAFFDAVLEAGRREPAPEKLSERVLEGIEYRERLHAGVRRSGIRRPMLGLGVGAGAALAAAAVLILSRVERSLPPIAPEPSSSPSRASAALPKPTMPDPCSAAIVAKGDAPQIDDFEDGDDAVTALEQRVGYWRWVREIDAPGTAPALIPVPRPEAAPRNRLALHVKGGQLVDWGAAVEFTFRPACYDASKYAGISFSARGPGRIYVAPRETATIPVAEGGTCEVDCHNPHVLKVDLADRFERYEIRWEQTRQRGMGKPPLDPSRLNSLAFLVRPEDTPYDVWLDDVRFILRSE
jgi:hypothetical protein